jgi:hypothetical protein
MSGESIGNYIFSQTMHIVSTLRGESQKHETPHVTKATK